MRDSEHDNQIKVLQQMYGDLHAEWGESARGVGWKSREGQNERFDALLNFNRELVVPQTMLDVGCGFGDLATYFRNWRRMYTAAYTGIDICPQYILAAKAKYGRYGAFFCRSVKEHAEVWGENSYELVVGSGVVGWWQDPFQPLTDMWYLAKKCMAFNWHEDTSQLTVQKVLAFCEMVGCSDWTIQHDYLDKDYTVHMYKGDGIQSVDTMAEGLTVAHA